MSNATDRVTTAEQLAAMPDDGKRYELVEGVLQMMSPAVFWIWMTSSPDSNWTWSSSFLKERYQGSIPRASGARV